MQLGKDYAHSVYQACNPKFNKITKTLWTNWIPKQDAQELLLDLSFAQEDQKPLYIYVQESNQTQNPYFRRPKRPVLCRTVEHPFPVNAVPRDENLSHAKGLYSENGFYLGFSYSGKCTFIASIQLFFMKCPTFAWNQMEFEETAAGRSRRVVCLNGSVEMECQSNGTWGPPQGSCDAGCQTDGNSYTADSTPVSKADFFPVTIANSTQGMSPVLTIVLCGLLVLLILIAAVFIFVRRYKLSGGQETELISSSGATRYRRSVQMLEGMSGMLCGLDVLVERTTLKMCRMLGKGEFGAVYEGIFSPQRGQDIRVAVKTSKEAIHNKEDLESFLKEAEIMKHFNHPNVVKLLGVVLERNPESSIVVPLVILPYMKHRDLHSFLKATRLGDVPMWSFGITMWEITSRGKLPYPGVSNHELQDLLEKGHRLSQGDNDSKLYEVMLSCWHRNPSQRPDFGELGQSLKVLLSELPPLEASKEAHYISLGLEAASDLQDSAEALEPEVKGML
ncbi:hypothetical protein ABG768_025575 [Culter alburnus]|uniref:Protein kinase domain-containing protein n=1 Tax=Culter alburnus TaxID=194366 RepID=A0AAW2AGU4_CULAL